MIKSMANFINSTKPEERNFGKYYGYPDCCIKEFYCPPFLRKTSRNLLPDNSTGFLPCANCAKLIVQGKTTLDKLLTNRYCAFPFPGDGIDCKCNIIDITDYITISKHIIKKQLRFLMFNKSLQGEDYCEKIMLLKRLVCKKIFHVVYCCKKLGWRDTTLVTPTIFSNLSQLLKSIENYNDAHLNNIDH